jgi:hypothetical protein
MKLLTHHFLPISIVRKLLYFPTLMPTLRRWWFIYASLVQEGRWAVSIIGVLSMIYLIRYKRRIALFIALGVVGQIAAYTVFPPTEPFVWYAAPVQIGMNFLMCGMVTSFARIWPNRAVYKPIAMAGLITCSAIAFAGAEVPRKWFVGNATYVEADRSRAGQWVAAHTPPSFRILTGFGDPAFYSGRFIYDSSGLNMTGDVRVPYIINTFHPEVLILCPFMTGISPENYKPIEGYKLVKYFDSARASQFVDFYAIVLVKETVLDQLH